MYIRYRKNINCLSNEELHDLREAYQALYNLAESSPDSFATLGGIHGLPAPGWCDHGAPGFLSWHRAYMRAFEKALQTVHCNLMLPFWDWSSGPTAGVPEACRHPTYVNRIGDTVTNPLYSGPIASAAGGGTTSRRPDIDTTNFGNIATAAQSALSSGNFSDFQSAINGPHGAVHGRTGGQMSMISLAGFDPIFFLHHCNVDRLWWNWQQQNPGTAIPANELNHELAPFNKPFTSEWQTGADVISTDALGYRYRNWCFLIPPILVWEVVTLPFDPRILERFRDIKLVIKSKRMPAESVEFRILLGNVDDVNDTKIDGNSAFAGSISTFGMGGMPMRDMKPSPSSNFDIGLNLTNHLRTKCSHLIKRADHCLGDDVTHEGMAKADDKASIIALKIAAFDVKGLPIEADRLQIDDIDLIID